MRRRVTRDNMTSSSTNKNPASYRRKILGKLKLNYCPVVRRDWHPQRAHEHLRSTQTSLCAPPFALAEQIFTGVKPELDPKGLRSL
jgi:hypothetical protein